ncbi:hypothetical protein LARV_01263 [Longilinea arvoryzae]|uniref:Uncharacterized protein n=1 Tax=Longilinea arvoryzae TaxID=360412 RepID=A0A0S7BI85_9CHLR|nr:hypothetical protein [Longilinea arvoryzae]GAP13509.1 hypothetical protein LARV_01263 [Longilinea arvoryzae]
MKTIESSPTTLALRRVPIGIWLFSLVFIGVGLVCGMLVGKLATLHCQRSGSGGECQFSTRGFIGPASVMTFAVEDLQAAELQVSEDSDDGDTYRVAFQVQGKWIPLTKVYSSGWSSKDDVVQNINTFIQNQSQTELNIRQDDRLFAALFGGIFSLAGLLMILFIGQIVTLRLDRVTGLVTLKRTGLTGVREGEYPLSDFTDAVLEYGRNTCRIALVTRDGGHLPLTTEYSSGIRGKEATAKQIREFLRPGEAVQDNRPEWLK